MKKIGKKLSLARETVRALSTPELDQVAGGGGDMIYPLSQGTNLTAPCRRISIHAAAFGGLCRTA